MRRWTLPVLVPSLTIAAFAMPGVASATTWSVRETPTFPKVEAQGHLRAASCTSSTACTAVGTFSGGPLADQWNGTEWSPQELPRPTGSTGIEVAGVSCSSSEACTAVGSYETKESGARFMLAERWNGKEWVIQTTPAPAGGTHAGFTSVSCPGAESCIAAGNYRNGGVQVTLAEKWNGKEWTVQTTANPTEGKEDTLNGISCTSSEACIAVGSYVNSSSVTVPLAEKLTGATWALKEPKTPTGAKSTSLAGVSCTSTTFCIAVGSYTNSAGTVVTLAEKWSGLGWTIQTTPTGVKTSRLAAVSCRSTEACTATGSDTNSGGTVLTLAEHWNGTEWSTQETPTPSGTEPTLAGVSCGAAEACIAVGSYRAPGSPTRTLAEHWNGSTWTTHSAPAPLVSATGNLDGGISCTATNACTAVGSYTNNTGVTVPLAERWNGTTWSIQTMPSLGEGAGGRFNGVTCTATEACTAAGSTGSKTLVEHWNGKEWTVQASSGPLEAEVSGFDDVSCTSSEACTAVGNYRPTGSSHSKPLAERWNGSTWTIQTTPIPVGATDSTLAGVSCAAAEACTAAGYYTNSESTQVALAENWNGKTWTIKEAPNPKEASLTLLYGVSCSAAEACTAVGLSDQKGTYHPLAERWNGKEWVIQEAAFSSFSELLSVSCSSATSCTAVGGYGEAKTLVEHWNGTTWATEESPNPTGSTENSLRGVSCLASGYCAATGRTVGASGEIAGLALEN